MLVSHPDIANVIDSSARNAKLRSLGKRTPKFLVKLMTRKKANRKLRVSPHSEEPAISVHAARRKDVDGSVWVPVVEPGILSARTRSLTSLMTQDCQRMKRKI